MILPRAQEKGGGWAGQRKDKSRKKNVRPTITKVSSPYFPEKSMLFFNMSLRGKEKQCVKTRNGKEIRAEFS